MLDRPKLSLREYAHNLGWVTDGDGTSGCEYRDEIGGPVLYTKWFDSDGRWWLSTPARLVPWGLSELAALPDDKRRTLVLAQTEGDRIACMCAGHQATLSTPNGSHYGQGPVDVEQHYDWMFDAKGIRKELRHADKIILATHSDAAGIILRDELIVRLGVERCWSIALPTGCVGARDVLVNFGAELLGEVLAKACPLRMDTLVKLEDVPEMPPRQSYGTGWHAMDPHLLVTMPELMIVTGTPNSGKSAWALNLGLNLARLHGLKGAFVQFEDDFERTRNELTLYTNAWKGQADRDGVIAIEDPMAWINENIRFVLPSEEEEDVRDLAWVRSTIQEASVRHGCKWIILDCWNELEHAWSREKSGTDYLNDAVRDLKRMARRYRIALIIIAHPDKTGGRNESVDEMTLYSISGGATWKNKADHGVIIGREVGETGATGNTIVKVDKCKDWTKMGIPGTVTLGFNQANRTFYSLK